MCKTDRDPVWVAWSGFGKTHLSGSKFVCRHHLVRFLAGRNRPATSFWQDATGPLPVSGRTQPARYQVLAGRNRPATSFWQNATGPLPVSHFPNRFRFSTDAPDNTVQKQPGSDLVLADCVRFWPNGSGPEASRCATIIRPASGQRFPANPDRMRIITGSCH